MSIMPDVVTLPKWLDDLIFNELGAIYRPMNSDMTNIDDNKEKTLNYLGTYFPRSYAEAFCIFTKFFKENNPSFLQKEELSIIDYRELWNLNQQKHSKEYMTLSKMVKAMAS